MYETNSVYDLDWEPKLCVRVYLGVLEIDRPAGGALYFLNFLKQIILLVLSLIRNRVNRKWHPGEARRHRVLGPNILQ